MCESTAKGRFFIETFGCQMNVNDSERVAGLLGANGYVATTDPNDADFVFVNTCAVREKAAQKLRSTVTRFRAQKKVRPSLRIGVGGCVAQLEGVSLLTKASGIDVLVGTHNIASLPQLLDRVAAGESGIHELDRKADPFILPSAQTAHGSPVRAYLTVMEGCNHVCSFCVVPRTRGPEICKAESEVLREARQLIDQGFAEIMLLGQTVNAWEDGASRFADLLGELDTLPGLERLRFTTSHPEHVNERLAEAFASLRTLCPYLHLPVQSGSDRILAVMRRGYDRQAYLDKLEMLRERVPGMAISSDVIVGYPGEDDDDFEATLGLLEVARFDSLFSFTYSPRPGTAAYLRPDDVPVAEKRRRLAVVNDRQQARQKAAHLNLVGTRQLVTVDAVSPDSNRVSGRTPHFRIVHLDGQSDWLGRSIDVEIVAAGANSLMGRVAPSGAE